MKQQLRTEYLNKRKQLSLQEVNLLSQAIADNFIKSDFFDKETFHIFMSIPKFNEVNTDIIIKQLWEKQKTVIVPKMQGKTLLNCHYKPDTKLDKNAWGIREPKICEDFSKDAIDIVLVPMLVADKKGFRIGYGGGYYDRFLSDLRPSTQFVGLNFFEPIEDNLPIDKFDVPLNYLITPQKIHSF